MSRLTVSKSKLAGQVAVPASKSHTIRAVALAGLAEGESTIRRPLESLDGQSAVKAFSALGAEIDTHVGQSGEPQWKVHGFAGRPRTPENVIDVGNSGTSLRLALAAASLMESGLAVFTGDEQIRRRPSDPLTHALDELGAHVVSTRDNGLPPYVVAGTLTGGTVTLQATSSQYLSALLIACPFAEHASTINVELLNEKPYVEMTLAWMDRLDLNYDNRDFKRIIIPGGQRCRGFDCTVPGDFSTATFFLCAAALAGDNVKLIGLDINDTQGDKAVIDYLKNMGADIRVENNAIVVSKSALRGVELDLNATPDALPALAVTACFAEGTTKLSNVPQARIKETDRLAVMTAELKKLGADITELPDGLIIEPSALHGGEVQGHDDHRVVMALAMAGLVTDDPVTVDSAEAAAVTVPQFVPLMLQLNAAINQHT